MEYRFSEKKNGKYKISNRYEKKKIKKNITIINKIKWNKKYKGWVIKIQE